MTPTHLARKPMNLASPPIPRILPRLLTPKSQTLPVQTAHLARKRQATQITLVPLVTRRIILPAIILEQTTLAVILNQIRTLTLATVLTAGLTVLALTALPEVTS